MPVSQLPLPVALADGARFENFFSTVNTEAHAAVRALTGGVLFLCGETGAGKTHLLLSAFRSASEQQRHAWYLSLTEPGNGAEPLAQIDGEGLCCIDDVHGAARDAEAERALLSLYERCRERGGALLASAPSAPMTVGFALRDLATRLASGTVYRLRPLDEPGKAAALRLRARRRGFELSDDVIRYVLTRYARDTKSLFALLDRLDDASLIAQRRITIPFLQQLER